MRTRNIAALGLWLWALTLLTPLATAQEKLDLLSGAYTLEKLKEIILPLQDLHPYPKTAEHEEWQKIPEKIRAAYIRQAEKHLNGEWETPKASIFLDFVRNGNRSRYEALFSGRRARLAELVIGECIENKGRFLDDILNGIWTTCEETYWGVPAHIGAQKRGAGLPDVTEPTVDLFAAETGMLLAWTDYLLGDELDRISPLVRERISYEIQRRILDVNLIRDDFWWMGLRGQMVNNWNPWISSNWLTAVLLIEKDPGRRIQSISKVLKCLDQFLNSYPKDGGCDEGPGYWDRAGGSLFDCLELLDSASNGRLNVYEHPLVKEIARYIGRVHISGRYYINFADAAAKVNANASLIFRFGKSIRDQDMMGFGAFLAKQQNLGEDYVRGSGGWLGRILPTLFIIDELTNAPPKEPLARDFWLPGLQVMGARSFEGSVRGLYIAAKGGHNAESHNHNDVGNFIVYADGHPVLIDVGVEAYTAKTFSNRRYEIWTMQSAYHNVPTINGVMQKDGRKFRATDVAYKSGTKAVSFSLDIARAYPEEAQLQSWKRTLTLERGKQVTLRDSYVLKNAGRPVQMTLMSLGKPELAAEGKIRLENPDGFEGAKPFFIIYDKDQWSANLETIPVEDGHLRSSWGERVYRILLTAKKTRLRAESSIRITQN
jgi:hypothetical protein